MLIMVDSDEARHSELVKDLEMRVRNQYTLTTREVPVRNASGQVVGEIDLLGIVGDEWHVYEVKLGNNRRKAVRQLTRLKNYLRDCGNLTLYYYSGATDELMKIDG